MVAHSFQDRHREAMDEQPKRRPPDGEPDGRPPRVGRDNAARVRMRRILSEFGDEALAPAEPVLPLDVARLSPGEPWRPEEQEAPPVEPRPARPLARSQPAQTQPRPSPAPAPAQPRPAPPQPAQIPPRLAPRPVPLRPAQIQPGHPPATEPGPPPPRPSKERPRSARSVRPAPARRPAASRRPSWVDRLLLGIELAALAGLVVTVVLSLADLRRLRGDLFGPPTPTASAESAAPVAWVEPTATLTPTVTATPTPTVTPQATDVPLPVLPNTPTPTCTPTPAPTPTAGATPNSPTGVRFVIPAIGVDAPMVEGDDWETLKSGIGHRIGSAWPGEVGNVVVSAHNDIHGAIFRNLDLLKPGDMVFVHTPTATYQYEVMFTRLVLPNEVSVTNPTRQPILTMITCYPPFVDTHRIVVTARLVQDKEQD